MLAPTERPRLIATLPLDASKVRRAKRSYAAWRALAARDRRHAGDRPRAVADRDRGGGRGRRGDRLDLDHGTPMILWICSDNRQRGRLVASAIASPTPAS